MYKKNKTGNNSKEIEQKNHSRVTKSYLYNAKNTLVQGLGDTENLSIFLSQIKKGSTYMTLFNN